MQLSEAAISQFHSQLQKHFDLLFKGDELKRMLLNAPMQRPHDSIISQHYSARPSIDQYQGQEQFAHVQNPSAVRESQRLMTLGGRTVFVDRVRQLGNTANFATPLNNHGNTLEVLRSSEAP